MNPGCDTGATSTIGAGGAASTTTGGAGGPASITTGGGAMTTSIRAKESGPITATNNNGRRIKSFIKPPFPVAYRRPHPNISKALMRVYESGMMNPTSSLNDCGAGAAIFDVMATNRRDR